MLFKPELAEKILKSEKTQTRRAKKEGERLAYDYHETKIVFDSKGHVKWKVGRVYAVQTGRGKPATGRFRLLDIREQELRYISPREAFDEGIRLATLPEETPEDFRIAFFKLWDSINPPGLQSGHNPKVWVLTFKVEVSQ